MQTQVCNGDYLLAPAVSFGTIELVRHPDEPHGAIGHRMHKITADLKSCAQTACESHLRAVVAQDSRRANSV